MADSNEWQKMEMGNTWKFTKPGDEISGVYAGKESGVGPNNSNLYNLQVDGQLVGVWGTTILDARMKNLSLGEEVKIVYLGEAPSKNRKGKSYHNFEVYHRAKVMDKVSDAVDNL